MKLFKRKSRQPLTRREIIDQRRLSRDLEASATPASFKRSRNLSDRRQLKHDSKSERQESWDLRKKRRKLFGLLGGILSLLLITLFILSQLIVEVAAKSTDSGSLDSTKYIQTTNDYLKSRPLERLRFLVNSDALQGYFLDSAPEVKTVKVVRGSGLASADILLTFRKPLVQWSSGGKIYYVDDEGITFENSYFGTPDVIVSDQSGLPAYAGQEIINRRFLSFLGQAVSQFSENNMKVTEVILPSDTIRQVEMVLDGRPYKIKMTIDRDASAQVGQTIHAIAALDARALKPVYIDVRVDQSVYYK